MTGSLQSEVEIGFRYDEARQRTVLARRQAGGLCHLGKAYWTGDVLGLQIVNPTAGIFSGDTLSVNVEIGAGARVALTSPSATRFHTMPTGRAEIVQRFSVGEGAWLDYWPEMVIPQKDADVRQVTEIVLQPSAQMVFLDMLAPGRVAHGERFTFRRLETQLEIREGETLLVKERSVIEPAEDVWPLKFPGWELCYYGAVWIAGERAEESITELAQWESDGGHFHCGASLLSPNLAVVRVIADSSIWLRKMTQRLRAALMEQFPLLATDFRKL